MEMRERKSERTGEKENLLKMSQDSFFKRTLCDTFFMCFTYLNFYLNFPALPKGSTCFPYIQK